MLTVVGVLVMMVMLSPTLALIALVTIPLTLVTTAMIAKRSQKLFVAQWKHTGRAERADRGDLHRARAGEGVRPAARGGGAVPAEERGAVPGEFRRAVHFRADHAGHDVHREPGLCGDRRGGRPAGGLRGDAAGGRAGVHPVLPAVHPAAGPARLHGEPAAVRGGVGRAGVRAAGHRGAGPDPSASVAPVVAGAGWSSRTSPSPTRRTSR